MNEQDERVADLYRRYAGRLFAYARRHADHGRAEDLVAGAFEVAVRRTTSLPADDGEAFAWLVGTVRKLAANQRRREATARDHWESAVRESWHTGVADSPEDAVAERDRCVTALAALAEADREALLLVAWEGLSPEQAAGVLGCSHGTFRVRLHRARQRLERALTQSTPALRAATRGMS